MIYLHTGHLPTCYLTYNAHSMHIILCPHLYKTEILLLSKQTTHFTSLTSKILSLGSIFSYLNIIKITYF